MLRTDCFGGTKPAMPGDQLIMNTLLQLFSLLLSLLLLSLWLILLCQAVEDAINAGIDRFSFDDRDRVKTAQKELRISDSLAKELLDTVSRKAFTGFVTRSRSQRDRLEAAKELKKLVFFSNIVVAPLLEDVQVRVAGRV